MVINFLLVDSKRDAIQLSDKPRLRNDPILYSRRSRAAVSRRRDLILRAAHCHSSRAISSSVPERTTSNSRVPGYRNDRCLGPNVAEENGWRGKGQRVRLKRRGKRESSRIMGVYRFLFSVAVETFKGRLSLSLSFFICRKLQEEDTTWSDKEGMSFLSCPAKLRSRGLVDGQSWYPSTERTRCLFVPLWCHNTPTTDRSGVLTSVMYLSRTQGASNLTKR